MKRAAMWLVGGPVVLAISVVSVAGGGAPRNPQATITFFNGGVDNIQSDGSAYGGGVAGVVAEIQQGSTPDGSWNGPTNLLLNIARTTSKPKRYLFYRYPESAKIDVSNPYLYPNASPYPCGYYPGSAGPTSEGVKVAGYVNIHSLGQIGIGEARAVRIHFGADRGEFLWLSPHNVATGSCSSTVVAYRDSRTTWQVASDIRRIAGATASSTVRLAADGVYEVLGTEPDWWDRPSSISQLNAGPSLGNYIMPFGLSVTCSTCPAPPSCKDGIGNPTPCPIAF